MLNIGGLKFLYSILGINMKSTGFTDLIRKSPFGPIQKHMEKSKLCVNELLKFLDAASVADWDKAIQSRKVILDLENDADSLKAETRALLPKSIFLAVPREDILDLIKLADDIPNIVKDISGLMLGRKMEIPQEINSSFLQFSQEASKIAYAAFDAMDQLGDLFQFSFGGNAANRMEELLELLDGLEGQNDLSEVTLRAELFSIEKNLPPVNVIFLYDIINKIGEISDRSEQLGHRISLIASR